MGYSQPKKQLDLKEFLSTPAKKPAGGKRFGFGKFPVPKSKPVTADASDEDTDD